MPTRSPRVPIVLSALLAFGLQAALAAAEPMTFPDLGSIAPVPGVSSLPDIGVVTQQVEDEALRAASRFASGRDRVASPSSVTATTTWSDESNVVGRELGFDLSTAGDVNGDGFSDFVALGKVGGANNALYLYFGSASGPTLAPGYPVTNLPATGALKPAGDVNGDGYADVVLYWYLNGLVRVYFGGPNGFNMASPNQVSGHFGSNVFGWNAAPAGDIDNDGFDDLIFGMPFMAGSQPCGAANSGGVVEVMYGSATGISATNNWYAFGCVATGTSAEFGTSVAGAGDVNGDGFADIAFSAPNAVDFVGPGGVAGKVYVMYGSATRLPLINGFTNVGSVTSGSMILGHHASSRFGASVAPAGDVNGDGLADIAVGAPSDDNFITNGGKVLVYRGTSAGIDSAEANTLWSELGFTTNAEAGRTVTPAGDVNGDGRPDLLVGLASSVWIAQSSANSLVVEQTLGYPAATSVVVTAGDVNGDGLSDLLVGESTFSNGESGEGRVMLHLGLGTPPTFGANWSTTQLVVDNPNFGWSVASAGDVNGDGYDDVLVGAPTWHDWTTSGTVNNGLVLLFFGHSTGLSPSYDWFTFGANNDQLGGSVASAGDVNGDGYGDVIIGAHQAAGGVGQARVWYGNSFGLGTNPNVTLTGFSPGALFGGSVSSAGDVNGDGYPDVIVGEPYGVNPSAPLSAEGRAYVYLGGPGGLATTPVWSGSGLQADAHYGFSVAAGGDVNGDSYGDILIGSPEFDSATRTGPIVPDAGRVFVVFGSVTGPFFNSTFTVNASWRLGASVSSAGDVNGDGYSDVIAGAPNATNAFTNEGAARVYIGGLGGVAGTLWTQFGGEAFGGFGASVASAGDMDGDGLSDVLVGGVFQEAGGTQDQGRAQVFRGPLTAGAPAFFSTTGGSAFANLGHSVALAGDVNGDGWSDLIFGMPGFTTTIFRQGFARVHLGSRGTAVNQLVLPFRQTPAARIIHPGTLTNAGQFLLFGIGRSAAGRTKVKMQYRVTTVPTFPLAPIAAIQSAWTATGTPGTAGSLASLGLAVTGLTSGVPYAWQMRALSKSVYYPTGIWRSPTRNGRLETDLRAPGSWLAVDSPQTPATLMLSDVRPNPMRANTSIAFTLTRPGKVALEIADVQGRRVRTLVRGDRAAGDHRMDWDGRSEDGAPVRAGIYFIKLEAEGRSLDRKVVVMR